MNNESSINKSFGRLTIIGFSPERAKGGGYIAICDCACGNLEIKAYLADLKAGKHKSCGCLKKERAAKQAKSMAAHGMSNHPLYDIYRLMMRRCYDKSASNYKNYGGRGIKVCDRWHDVSNFVEDLQHLYVKGLEINRIDNSKDYEPDNVNFVTKSQNMRNTRANKYVAVDGVKMLITDAASITGIPLSTISVRLKDGRQSTY